MTKRLNAAIVGLGQVGLLFDEDSKRKGVWTHFTAYERLGKRVNLVAVCDPDKKRQQKALKRRHSVHVYGSLSQMLAREKIDLLSLCTPPALHARQIREAAGKVKAIICEKPLSERVADGKAAVTRCGTKTALAVNYYKRFESPVEQMKALLKRKTLGRIHSVIGNYSGPFGAVGSHMVDTMRYLFGDWDVVSAHRAVGEEEAYSAILKSGTMKGIVNWSGRRHDLVFELDVIGTAGRALMTDNFSTLRLSRFQRSKRYGGYRELSLPKKVPLPRRERFLPLFEDVVKHINGGKLVSSGRDALKTQELMEKITRNARS